MKKIWGWIVGIGIVAVAIFYFIFNGSGSTIVATNPNVGANGNPPATGTAGQGSPSSSNTGGNGAAGQYKDGSYTGPVADAIYGQLQIVATVSGGKITDISWPVYPNSGGHSSQVSAFALPQLKQEAIAAQNANVNIVSGATQTSQAFQQSLATALVQAKA